MHKALGGTKKQDSSESLRVCVCVWVDVGVCVCLCVCTFGDSVYTGIVYKVFQGAMKVYTRKLPPASEVGHVLSHMIVL